MTTFGDRARELMAARDISLRELARRTFYDKAHLSRVLNGHKAAGAELAARLDAELGADGSLVALADERLALAEECPHRVDGAVLDSVAALLGATRRLEDVTSAATVLPTVREYLTMVERFAAEAGSSVRPAAVGLASELHQYAGWLHVPLRRWQVAERLMDRATVLGMEADDPQRTATALSFAGYTAMRRGDFRRADALSEAAARDTRVDVGLRTYVTYQRAEVLALNGEPTDAYRLLGQADAMVDHLPDPAELPDAGYWYTPAFFLGNRAFVLDKLGEHAVAKRIMAESLAELPEQWRTSEWAERRRAFVAA
ncbi:MAG TPA: helix-turn-helix transcriptional regulator [Actinophytocola sp.]|uniref:helix-turn-helix transcriptional regulator n=1 Tax=Actinophytocola sp. TaxID=1872138 RepID=UPI002DDD6ADE|nr:helix-turn-helix transcriptional regulator [Actinophytocola sp.]HEV2784710.1 helix-turn-helix transcriptional regulator [Actinophytocola sp.]